MTTTHTDWTAASWFPALFDALGQDARLQRIEWWLNQPLLDRALEAILIIQTRREIATGALLSLKARYQPDRVRAALEPWSLASVTPAALCVWGRGQGPGAVRLVKALEPEARAAPDRASCADLSPSAMAALFTLRYYHCREDENPLVQQAWEEAALDRIAAVSPEELLDPALKPTAWHRQFPALQAFLRFLREQGGYDPSVVAEWGDETLRQRLLDIPGIGEETADVISLYFFGRTQAVIDQYLGDVLTNHGGLPPDMRRSYAFGRAALLPAIREFAAQRGLAAWEVASCFHLWIDETARFWCHRANPECCSCALAQVPFGSWVSPGG
jgi:endonuclease III-like uncharacterized protein